LAQVLKSNAGIEWILSKVQNPRHHATQSNSSHNQPTIAMTMTPAYPARITRSFRISASAARAISCHQAESEYRPRNSTSWIMSKLLSFADLSILLQYDKSATISCLDFAHCAETSAINRPALTPSFRPPSPLREGAAILVMLG
jgi:hypothetical protein